MRQGQLPKMNPLQMAALGKITGMNIPAAMNAKASQDRNAIQQQSDTVRNRISQGNLTQKQIEHQLVIEKFEYQKQKDDAAAQEAEMKGDRKTAEGLREGNIIIQDLNRALELIIENPYRTTGLVGKAFKYNPHSDAGKVLSHITSASDLISLDKLRRMRENSVSGASGMGQLSVQEGERLKKAFGSIDQDQDSEIVIANTKRATNLLMDTIHGTPEHIKKAFEEGKMDEETYRVMSFRWDLPYDKIGKKKLSPEEEAKAFMEGM